MKLNNLKLVQNSDFWLGLFLDRSRSSILAIAITMFGIAQTTLAQDGWTKTYSTMASDSIYVHAGGSQGSNYAIRVEVTNDQTTDSVIYGRKVELTAFDGNITLDRRAWVSDIYDWITLAIHRGDTTIKVLGQAILPKDTIFSSINFTAWSGTLSDFDSISLIVFATDWTPGTQIADFDNFSNGAGTIFYDGGEKGTVSGVLFYDLNQNGVKDNGEAGIDNWKLYLVGTTTDSTTTNSNGDYVFTAVSRGTYTIKAESKIGWTPTTPDSIIVVGDTLHWVINFGEYAPLAYYMAINSRWNMVALPKRAYEPNVTALFPTAISNAFSYNGTYTSVDTLEIGVGYWLKFPESTSVTIVGDSINADTVTVQEGWNMIGGLTEGIAVNDVMIDPPTMTTSQFFTYDGSYITSDSIKPGLGYWVKASEAGELILNTGSKAVALNRIRIMDRGELPPPLPESREAASSRKPTTYMLDQNYPNPFNPTTNIQFSIVSSQLTILKVYDVLGREVATLVNEMKQPGTYTVEWDASRITSGMYFYRLQSGNYIETKKLVLLK